MKKFCILSLDAGGPRSIIQAFVLHSLDILVRKKTGTNSSSLFTRFDYFAGSGTGGLTALLASLRTGDGKAYLWTKDICQMFIRNFSQLFNGKAVITMHRHTDEIIPFTYADRQFSTSTAPCLVPLFDLSHTTTHLVKSHIPTPDAHSQLTISELAALTLTEKKFSFSPHPALLHGGFTIPNPTLFAYYDALVMNGEMSPENIVVLSIGTGLPFGKETHKRMEEMFAEAGYPHHYIRIEPAESTWYQVMKSGKKFDDTDIRLCEEAGLYTSMFFNDELDWFADLLVNARAP